MQLCIPLIKGLLKFWPITCPAKEVIFINEIEEVLEVLGNHANDKFNEFGPALLKRLLATAKGMHYQAAERALVLLNSDVLQKLVRQNSSVAYPLVVKGLLRGSNQAHWNQTVTTMTYSVIRTYMEFNRDQFEKITVQAQQEARSKATRQKESENKWAKLNKKLNVAEEPPLFPLIQFKPPAGFEEAQQTSPASARRKN